MRFRAGTRRGFAAGAGCALAFLLAPGAEGYLLYHFNGPAAGGVGADAVKWADEDLPVRFRMLRNDNLSPEDFPTHAAWRDFVVEVFDQWNDIETAREILVVDPEPVAEDEASGSDGLNTIGFSSYFARNDFPYSGFAAWQFQGGALSSCDIELNPEFRIDEDWETRESAMVRLILHEVGHCLGLLHSAALPMPFDYDLPELELAGFDSDPIMSYGRQKDFLTRDDEIGVSVLYPAPGFAEATGTLYGDIRFADNEPARFAYVQAIEIGETNARAGPGTFASNSGTFTLEGVRPGPVMLWIHSFVIGVAHASFREEPGEWETRFPHAWVFAEAEAGDTVFLPMITLQRGVPDLE